MDIPRKRIPLFYAALALTLLHPQFFTPGVLTIPRFWTRQPCFWMP